MKRNYVAMLVLTLAIIFCCATFATAKDIQITKEIDQITFKKDKNGNDYARVIVTEKRTLNGVTYDRSVVVMAFAEQAAKLKGYKKGQKLNAIVEEGEYKGNVTYRILDVIK